MMENISSNRRIMTLTDSKLNRTGLIRLLKIFPGNQMSTKNKFNSLSDNYKHNEDRRVPIRKDLIVKSGLWRRKRKDFKTK